MKIKELIQELQKYDQEIEIFLPSTFGDFQKMSEVEGGHFSQSKNDFYSPKDISFLQERIPLWRSPTDLTPAIVLK